MKISYWSDYACPYCYIGEARLKKAIAELGIENEVELETFAFELNPDAPKTVESDTVTRFGIKYHLSPAEAAAEVERISQMGRAEGIDFRYATTLYTNTRDAHRLTKLAQSKGDAKLTEKLVDLLFDAYFTKNLKLAEPQTLLSIAKEVGLDEAEVKSMLDSDQFIDDVRMEEHEAMTLGVHGVPYFLINGKFAIPGAISVRAFKHTLERALKDEKDNPETAHQCGPDGCRIF